MITEDYVSFEIAKLLKEKGFDEPVMYHFTPDGTRRKFQQAFYKDDVAQPTLQMAMKWLREKHGRIILVNFFRKDRFSYDILLDGECGDNYILHSGYMFEHFQTYEEAVEAAIKYSLENLI